MRNAREHRGEYSDNDYFRMGAAIAVGELSWLAALGEFLDSDDAVREYLASFDIRGIGDIDALNIGDPYRSDFERLYGVDSK